MIQRAIAHVLSKLFVVNMPCSLYRNMLRQNIASNRLPHLKSSIQCRTHANADRICQPHAWPGFIACITEYKLIFMQTFADRMGIMNYSLEQ